MKVTCNVKLLSPIVCMVNVNARMGCLLLENGVLQVLIFQQQNYIISLESTNALIAWLYFAKIPYRLHVSAGFTTYGWQ